jgi:hypothetical protein
VNEAEATEVRRALAMLNEARKARELGNTEAQALEAEARAILSRLLALQEHKEG